MKSGDTDSTTGYAARTVLADATAWIDEQVARLEAEDVELAEAAGRVLAQGAVATVDVPPYDRAAIDGLAVRADDTFGASAYNPPSLRLAPMSDALPSNAGIALNAGDPLPMSADAVVPLALIEQHPSGRCDIIEAVPAGSGVEPKASHIARGALLLEAGRRLRPQDVGLLAAAGVARVPVTRRPRVHCFLVAPTIAERRAPPPGILHDANGPLLRALVTRDGGTVAELRQIDRGRAAIRGALSLPGSDLIIVVGGTGPGSADASAAALAEAGRLAIHGVALQPGETAGLGRTDIGVPVFLLPGAPTACLWAYEFFAGRAIRRLAGRNPALPFRACKMKTLRKIVSAIGMTEICPVRGRDADSVEPVASFSEAGLVAAAEADGFVIIPEGNEGFAEGATVTVRWFEEHDGFSGRTSEEPDSKS